MMEFCLLYVVIYCTISLLHKNLLSAKHYLNRSNLLITPFQNGSIEAKKALTILILKKYLKSWCTHTIFYVFFKKKQFFLKKIFLAQTHLEGPKISCRQKIFFRRFSKKLRKNLHLFFDANFFWSFLKKNFCLQLKFRPSRWV